MSPSRIVALRLIRIARIPRTRRRSTRRRWSCLRSTHEEWSTQSTLRTTWSPNPLVDMSCGWRRAGWDSQNGVIELHQHPIPLSFHFSGFFPLVSNTCQHFPFTLLLYCYLLVSLCVWRHSSVDVFVHDSLWFFYYFSVLYYQSRIWPRICKILSDPHALRYKYTKSWGLC